MVEYLKMTQERAMQYVDTFYRKSYFVNFGETYHNPKRNVYG